MASVGSHWPLLHMGTSNSQFLRASCSSISRAKKSDFLIPVVPHKAVAEVSKIGNL
jgi:hypothetical protein